MAKILFGVAGEGFGHSSRSELLGQRLIDAGHEVIFAASQKSLEYLDRSFPGKVYPVFGLCIVYTKGGVCPVQTVLTNFMNLGKGMLINRKLFKMAKEFKPDIVISDFEPFSAWWATFKGIPCVSVNHEHILTKCNYEHKWARFLERWMARTVTRGYHTFAKAYVVLNFFKVPTKCKKTIVVPPVVRDAVLQFEPNNSGDHIIVYSTDTGKKRRRQLIDMFSKFPDQHFMMYGFRKDMRINNVTLKPVSKEGFLADLASCRGILATGGFSLLSECLYLKKPMLLVPVRNQFEQRLNAHFMHQMGLGMAAEKLTEDSIREFLTWLEKPRDYNQDQLIQPDNERYFSIVEDTFASIGYPISLKPQVEEELSEQLEA